MASAQSFSSFIDYLNTLPESERPAVVDAFLTEAVAVGIPYINGDTANFIYMGNAGSVTLAGDMNGWDPAATVMTRVSGTILWYCSRVFEMNARLDYKFVINGNNWVLDELNPNLVSGGFGPNSELAMPGYIQPWEIEEITGTPQGEIDAFLIKSTNTGSTFEVRVYLPAGYNPEKANGYPVAYFQDGPDYLLLGSADNVLDNLIHSGAVDTILAVFVKPNNRNEEYAGSLRNQYRIFFVDELTPYIDETYNTMKDPSARAVCGDSYGANISALISYNHPDVFGNCGLHSGAFQPNGYEAYNLVTNGPVKAIKWASVWGSYETGLYDKMRDFRDFLLNNDYELHWLELPEGHSWGQWRATIDELLVAFFPGPGPGIPENDPKTISDLTTFPNPFTDTITLSFALANKSRVVVIVNDEKGESIMNKDFGLLEEGRHEAELYMERMAQGIYFCTLRAGDESHTLKIIKQ